MTTVAKIDGDLRVGGDLTVDGDIPSVARTDIVQETLAKYPIPLWCFRTHDALQTNLPGTSSADDLGLSTGTIGTDSPKLTTGDVKASTVTRYARVQVPLPAEYDAAETIKVRISGGMETTAADASATVDVECYKIDREGAVGSDICATAAQSINSLTFGDDDFTITETGLTAGDILDIRLTVYVEDAATATAVTASLGAVELLCDIRG